MSDQTPNGADHSAATNGAAAPAPPVPARAEREQRPTERRSFLDRPPARSRDDADFDFGRIGSGIESQSDTKLAATTRMVNGFMGYLKDACGRDADKMTPQDVAGLGSMLSLLQSLDAKRGGH